MLLFKHRWFIEQRRYIEHVTSINTLTIFLNFSGKEVLEDVASSMQKRFFASSSSLNWIENDRSIRFGAILISKILISQKKFLSWDGIFINISAFVVVVVWFISVFKVLVQHFSNLLFRKKENIFWENFKFKNILFANGKFWADALRIFFCHLQICCQSCKDSTSVNYDSRVVNISNLLTITTLES